MVLHITKKTKWTGIAHIHENSPAKIKRFPHGEVVRTNVAHNHELPRFVCKRMEFTVEFQN